MRSIAVGSLGGLAAAKRSECDLAPMHLLDEKPRPTTRPIPTEGLHLFPGLAAEARHRVPQERSSALRRPARAGGDAAAPADPASILVNRNQSAGTRILIDRLLGGERPDGYWNQPSSHNALAAAVAQERADWGMTIEKVARALGLGFSRSQTSITIFQQEMARKHRPAVQAFLEALASDEGRAALEKAGFRPA